jgi:multiple sugar transport system substrate-binding protein
MLKKCPDKQLCADLIEYITSPKQMDQYHKVAVYPPLTKGTDYTTQPEFTDLYADSSLLHQLPALSGATEVYNILYAEMQKMMLGQESPADALKAAAAAGDDALAKAAGK